MSFFDLPPALRPPQSSRVTYFEREYFEAYPGAGPASIPGQAVRPLSARGIPSASFPARSSATASYSWIAAEFRALRFQFFLFGLCSLFLSRCCFPPSLQYYDGVNFSPFPPFFFNIVNVQIVLFSYFLDTMPKIFSPRILSRRLVPHDVILRHNSLPVKQSFIPGARSLFPLSSSLSPISRAHLVSSHLPVSTSTPRGFKNNPLTTTTHNLLISQNLPNTESLPNSSPLDSP